MVTRCQDILMLPSLNNLKIIGGFEGLDRRIRWTYVAEILPDTQDILDWLSGGELLFITGIRIQDNTDILIDLVAKCESKNLAGLVIFIGPYIRNIPQEVISLANQLKFPLFELPWEVRLVEVTHDICSFITTNELKEKSLYNLLENILFSDFDYPENLISRGALYGYDLTIVHQVAIVDLDDFSDYLQNRNIKDEKIVVELKNRFQQIIEQCLSNNGVKALSMLRSDSMILLLPIQKSHYDKNKDITDTIRNTVNTGLDGLTVSIGIGNSCNDLKDMRKSLREAEQALKVAKTIHSKNTTCLYKDLGLYRLLLKIQDHQELIQFYEYTLGTLSSHDKLYHTQLINTLEVFLEENGNMVKAAEKLYIHRNTLKYRIKKIQEISGYSLENGQDRFDLQLGLRIGKFIYE